MMLYTTTILTSYFYLYNQTNRQKGGFHHETSKTDLGAGCFLVLTISIPLYASELGKDVKVTYLGHSHALRHLPGIDRNTGSLHKTDEGSAANQGAGVKTRGDHRLTIRPQERQSRTGHLTSQRRDRMMG